MAAKVWTPILPRLKDSPSAKVAIILVRTLDRLVGFKGSIRPRFTRFKPQRGVLTGAVDRVFDRVVRERIPYIAAFATSIIVGLEYGERPFRRGRADQRTGPTVLI